jgi:hypothetical protein
MLSQCMVPDHTHLTWSMHSNLSWVVDRFRRIPLLQRKRISDYTLSTSTDRSVGPHPVSPPLSTKEVVGLSQASVNSHLLGLPGPYLWYAISTFNTCSRGPIHWSLTDTDGAYNLRGAGFPYHTPRPSQLIILRFPPNAPRSVSGYPILNISF